MIRFHDFSASKSYFYEDVSIGLALLDLLREDKTVLKKCLNLTRYYLTVWHLRCNKCS